MRVKYWRLTVLILICSVFFICAGLHMAWANTLDTESGAGIGFVFPQDSYTVVFYPNHSNAVFEPPVSVSGILSGDTVGLNRMPTSFTPQPGYRFVRWVQNQPYSNIVFTADTPVYRNIDVYAQWILIEAPVSPGPPVSPEAPILELPPPVPPTSPSDSIPPDSNTPLIEESGSSDIPSYEVSDDVFHVTRPDSSTGFTIEFSEYQEAFMIGFPDGTIRPHGYVTRAEIASIFFRLMSDTYRIYIWSQDNPFNDTHPTDWYNNAVSTLFNDSLLTGFPDGSFRGTQAMTRGELVVIVSRFIYDLPEPGYDRFEDIYGHWASDAINSIYQFYLIRGDGDGTFNPNRYVTRAEVSALISRMLNRNADFLQYMPPNFRIWPDNADPNAWYYLYIQEATHTQYYEMYNNGEAWINIRPPRDWTALEQEDSNPWDI